jgi:hypothetical protein
MFRDEVLANGDEVSVMFATWNMPDRRDMAKLIGESDVEHALLIQPPSERLILDLCGQETLPRGNPVRNVFFQYYLSKIGLQALCDIECLDRIVHTRPDLTVRLGKHYPIWFSHEPGTYVVPHDRVAGQLDTFTNDQFAVARPQDMLKAWNYGSMEDLARLIRSSTIAEDPLHLMIERTDVLTRSAPTEAFYLDADRYVGDQMGGRWRPEGSA